MHWDAQQWTHGRYNDYQLCPEHVRALHSLLKFNYTQMEELAKTKGSA
jgi:hypothetical protein